MKFIVVVSLALLTSSCQVGYLLKSSYHQMALLYKRVPVEEALQDPHLDEKSKNKLRLAQEAKAFAQEDLKLAANKNYSSYVQLDQPYVTYVVSAAPKWKLEHHLWSFPMVGKVPYKGYFKEADAKDEQEGLKKKDLDTYMRGVSAYSTLGWFKDPVLSSMLRYKDHILVNTIIHETVHVTLFIKSSADFNERMAVFLGNKGTDLFYRKKEGANSPTLKMIQDENEDDRVFSEFIGSELKSLKVWYEQLPKGEQTEDNRQKRLAEIKERFKNQIQPHMKTDSFQRFSDAEINNARLMVYKTYMQDLSDFEKLFQLTQENITEFLKCCGKLKDDKKPEEGLKKIIEEMTRKKSSTCP